MKELKSEKHGFTLKSSSLKINESLNISTGGTRANFDVTYISGEDVASAKECCIMPCFVPKCSGIYYTYTVCGGKKLWKTEVWVIKSYG